MRLHEFLNQFKARGGNVSGAEVILEDSTTTMVVSSINESGNFLAWISSLSANPGQLHNIHHNSNYGGREVLTFKVHADLAGKRSRVRIFCRREQR